MRNYMVGHDKDTLVYSRGLYEDDTGYVGLQGNYYYS